MNGRKAKAARALARLLTTIPGAAYQGQRKLPSGEYIWPIKHAARRRRYDADGTLLAYGYTQPLDVQLIHLPGTYRALQQGLKRLSHAELRQELDGYRMAEHERVDPYADLQEAA